MDRISSSNPPSYPINKALSAYGKNPRVNRPGGTPYASQVSGVRRSEPAAELTVAQPTRQTDPVGKIAPSPMDQRAGAISELVGAKVQPIDLSSDVAQVTGPKPTVTSAGTYTMYPQAADRVQAATNLASNLGTGRSLDIRG
ncbi:MAG: hypothetical protein CMJ35_11665 [Phycisphaerae bacterium]|nr:hypothetical protein [Phycisphaerae bacterium]MBM92251.1 hypothetical protein [Phycisphaerae bacterium]HCT45072.1 hypothetical protein [Phycisphaerales bacterium]|tara:strand:+ start:410 stop:835 length:426 start_codon:yes stop_codon:yes gene_type:complete